jgi:cytochrome c oxidase cbb3-type subunit I/II
MPAYPNLLRDDLDFDGIQSRVDAMALLGVPYGDAVTSAAAMARSQAAEVAASIVQGGGEAGLERKEIVALVAYMQRLGRDAQGSAVGGPAGPASGSGNAPRSAGSPP